MAFQLRGFAALNSVVCFGVGANKKHRLSIYLFSRSACVYERGYARLSATCAPLRVTEISASCFISHSLLAFAETKAQQNLRIHSSAPTASSQGGSSFVARNIQAVATESHVEREHKVNTAAPWLSVCCVSDLGRENAGGSRSTWNLHWCVCMAPAEKCRTCNDESKCIVK